MRSPLEAIESIIPLIPDDQADLLAELDKCRASAQYAAPELHHRVFMRATAALEAGLGPPPLDGWREKVRARWMNEEPAALDEPSTGKKVSDAP